MYTTYTIQYSYFNLSRIDDNPSYIYMIQLTYDTECIQRYVHVHFLYEKKATPKRNEPSCLFITDIFCMYSIDRERSLFFMCFTEKTGITYLLLSIYNNNILHWHKV